MEAGSARTGRLADGCVMCQRGSKMVLLVSGRCSTGCFYCPLSPAKKGHDVVYADEMPVRSDDDIVREAEVIGAEGTGITGGDPVSELDRTLRLIALLKERFGRGHHIHLYTSSLDVEAFRRLEEAGLDELRLHPPMSEWARMSDYDLSGFLRSTSMDVGLEVPAIPGMEADLKALMSWASSVGLRFVNLNELEFSEANWDAIASRGFQPADDESAAVLGSEETALDLLKRSKIPAHYCSSTFKDSVQLRMRLRRRAERVAAPSDVVTEDGTLLKGVVDGPADDVRSLLRDEYDVPDDLMRYDDEKKRMEVAPWVLEELAPELPWACFLVEEYPTADRLEVERSPIRPR